MTVKERRAAKQRKQWEQARRTIAPDVKETCRQSKIGLVVDGKRLSDCKKFNKHVPGSRGVVRDTTKTIALPDGGKFIVRTEKVHMTQKEFKAAFPSNGWAKPADLSAAGDKANAKKRIYR